MRASPSAIVPAIVNGMGSDVGRSSRTPGASGNPTFKMLSRGGFTARTVNVRESKSVWVGVIPMVPGGLGSVHVADTLMVNVSAPRSPAGTAVATDHEFPRFTSNETVAPFGSVTVTLGLPM